MDVKQQHIVKSAMLFHRLWREQLVEVSGPQFWERA